MRVLVLPLMALACQVAKAADSPRAAAPARTNAQKRALGAPKTHGAPAPTSSVWLEPLAPAESPSALPQLEVLEPVFGDTVDPLFAPRQPVRVRASQGTTPSGNERVLLSLDGRHPRRWLPELPLRLGDLAVSPEDLLPGAHSLIAVAVSEDGRALRSSAVDSTPVALVTFFIGPRTSAPPPTTPGLFCLTPAGTYYLEPNQTVPFEVIAVGIRERAVSLEVRASGSRLRTTFDPARSYTVHGLPLGDSIFSIGSRPGPQGKCEVTVNPAAVQGRR